MTLRVFGTVLSLCLVISPAGDLPISRSGGQLEVVHTTFPIPRDEVLSRQ